MAKKKTPREQTPIQLQSFIDFEGDNSIDIYQPIYKDGEIIGQKLIRASKPWEITKK